MYPQAELNALAERKAALLARITVERDECALHLSQALKPVEWLAQAYAKWRTISPFVKVAAVPLGLFLKHKLLAKAAGGERGGGLFRWVPSLIQLFRFVR